MTYEQRYLDLREQYNAMTKERDALLLEIETLKGVINIQAERDKPLREGRIKCQKDLNAMTARANKAEAANSDLNTALMKEAVRADKAEAKLKVADAMLSEIWGAYNRIGDALRMPEKQAIERGEV